ncbi:hypothetical protein IIA79_01710 [bacterium]|nr:hypothetical protein [bacterium]
MTNANNRFLDLTRDAAFRKVENTFRSHDAQLVKTSIILAAAVFVSSLALQGFSSFGSALDPWMWLYIFFALLLMLVAILLCVLNLGSKRFKEEPALADITSRVKAIINDEPDAQANDFLIEFLDAMGTAHADNSKTISTMSHRCGWAAWLLFVAMFAIMIAAVTTTATGGLVLQDDKDQLEDVDGSTSPSGGPADSDVDQVVPPVEPEQVAPEKPLEPEVIEREQPPGEIHTFTPMEPQIVELDETSAAGYVNLVESDERVVKLVEQPNAAGESEKSDAPENEQ